MACMAASASAATYTVYVCDTNNWGPDKCRVHIWDATGGGGDYMAWDNDPFVTDTETTVEYNGAQVPVYSYTFDWDYEPTNIIVRFDSHDQSNDFTFINNAYYTLYEADIFAAPSTYTVYYIDTEGWGAENTLVHVWNETMGIYKGWDDNEAMTAIDKKYATTPDGKDGLVYSYTFEWNKTPTNIIFHRKNGGKTDQTADYSFTDGAWYSFSNQGIGNVELKPFEMRTYTVYLADNEGWGAENTQVMVVDQGGNALHPYLEDETMTDLDKIYFEDGEYYNVYSYTFTMEYPIRPVTVRFHVGENTIKRTQDLNFKDSSMYFKSGRDLSSWEYADTEQMKTTIYFCSGQYKFEGADRMTPRCHVRLADLDNPDSDIKAYTPSNSPKEQMRRISENLWAFDVVGIERFNDVKFYMLPDGIESTYYYTASNSAKENSAGFYDSDNWTKWIYAPGKMGGAVQSYMTIGDYYNIQDSEKLEYVYITGNKAAGFDPEWEPAQGVKIEADAGVFFYKIHTQAETGAAIEQPRYKITTVVIPDMMEKYNQEYNNQRAWATFNLGLVGCADDSKAVAGFQGADNSVVFFDLNVPMAYNSVNVYDWTVSTNPDHVSVEPDHDYWMVIDTHEGCRSLTLSEFDPNPSVEIDDVTVTPVEIGYERAMALHEGKLLSGAVTNGDVYFDKVNVTTGTAHFKTQDIDYLTSEQLVPEYTVYINSHPVAVNTGTADDLVINYLPVDADIPVAVRAKYISTQSGLQFHSRTGHGSISGASVNLPEPVTAVRSANLLRNTEATTGESVVFDVIAEFDYDVESDMVSYPDFSFTLNGTANDAMIDPDKITFDPYDGESGYTDGANWSKAISEGKMLPIKLDNALSVDDLDDPTLFETSFEGQLYAVFPFMVANNPISSAVPVRQNVRRAAPQLPDDLDGYEIVTGRTAAIHPVSLNRQSVTGIETISTENDTPVRYYSLQGVAVTAPQPGVIVIRICGNEARKMIVK